MAKIMRYLKADKVWYEHDELVKKMQATSSLADKEEEILKI